MAQERFAIDRLVEVIGDKIQNWQRPVMSN
jgi:hypothetical protein